MAEKNGSKVRCERRRRQLTTRVDELKAALKLNLKLFSKIYLERWNSEHSYLLKWLICRLGLYKLTMKTNFDAYFEMRENFGRSKSPFYRFRLKSPSTCWSFQKASISKTISYSKAHRSKQIIFMCPTKVQEVSNATDAKSVLISVYSWK